MMRLLPWAVLAAFLALGAAIADPVSPASGPMCGMDVARAAQNDGDSARDAGDDPGAAVAVTKDDYVWGWLDPEARGVATDSDDWFSAWVPDGPRVVVFGVIDALDYRPPVPPTYVVTFHISVRAPDGSVYENDSTSHANWSVPSTTAGLWLVHATPDVVATEPVLCEQASAPVDGRGVWPHEAADYGVYFGCNPVCFYNG